MNTEIKMRAALNASPLYKTTIQFLTNEEMDQFIQAHDPKWINKYNGCLGLTNKCYKVLELMTQD